MRPLTFHVPTCRAKILRSRETLEALADRLVSSDPVDARGVARVRLLLTDGSGAIYARPTADDLQPALERSLVALTMWMPCRLEACSTEAASRFTIM